MTEDTERRSETGRDRDRIVNLTDGVFAIAITLLVLDIRVPDVPEGLVATELPGELLTLWPKYLGYVLSFLAISIFWTVHHSIFRNVRDYDRGLIWLNFVFLMFVAFVPFPTSLLSEYGNYQLPVAVYAGTLAIGRLLLTTLYWYVAVQTRLVYREEEPQMVRFFLVRDLAIPVIFLLSIAVSFFSVSVAIWSWVVMIVADATILHRRRRH